MTETITEPNIKPKNNHVILKQLWRSTPARIGGLILILFYLLSAFADFFAPYSMNFADPDLANAPPTKIHFIIKAGSITGPLVYPMVRDFDSDTYKQVYSEQRIFLSRCNFL